MRHKSQQNRDEAQTMVFFIPSKRFIVQAVTLALTGGGMYVAKRWMPLPRLHPLIASRSIIVEHEAGLSLVLSQLAQLDMPTTHLNQLVEMIEQIIKEARSSSYYSQGRISRLNGEAIRLAHQMCDHAASLSSTSLANARNVLIAREDVIPVLISMLQDVLHNHLLSRVQ